MNAQLAQMLGHTASMGPPQDGPQVDTAETVHISSLALIKVPPPFLFSIGS